jgi:hypothetical protein
MYQANLKKKPWLVFCFWILSSIICMAQDQTKIEAIFITRFVEYIEWPTGKVDFTIGVVGNSRVLLELQEIVKVQGKKIAVKKITGATDSNGCNIVFIPENESKNFVNIKSITTGKSVLIITENKDLAQQGAGISFYTEGGKLKFILNKAAIETQTLKISSSLLSIAKVI